MLPHRRTLPAVHRIARPALSEAEAAGDVARLEAVEGKVLRDLRGAWAEAAPAAKADPSPVALSGHFEGFRQSRLADLLRWPLMLDPILLRDPVRMIAPPYDLGWATGSGMPLAQLDGGMIAIGDDGSGTSGFGITISSPERVFTTIEFSGSYQFSWSSFGTYPGLSSSGGLATCVYRGADAAPVLVRRSTLWAVRSPQQFTGETRSGPLSEVRVGDPGPRPGAFASDLLPVSLLMEPDVRYTVWLWIWLVGAGLEGNGFLAILRANVPLVTLTTSEPYVPPLH